MILDNGVIRTLDPSLPTCGALAIAGPLVTGGVGTHEWALPTPERVDLGGRCVLPAFTDSHVHFPTWALARRDVRLEDAGSVGAALAARRVACERRRHLDPRHGLARRGRRGTPYRRRARLRHRRDAGRPLVEGLSLALVELAGLAWAGAELECPAACGARPGWRPDLHPPRESAWRSASGTSP